MDRLRAFAGVTVLAGIALVPVAVRSAHAQAPCNRQCDASQRDASGCCPGAAAPNPQPARPPSAASPKGGTFGDKCATSRECSGELLCLDYRCQPAPHAAPPAPPPPAPPLAATIACPPTMAAIAGGTYVLGARSATVGAYCLDRTEVTVNQYGTCVAGGACTEPVAYNGTNGQFAAFCNWHYPGRAMHPVNCVSWTQAVSYCASAGMRLPTEEEWEWAARNGPQGSTFPWGDDAPTAPRVNACGTECPPNSAAKGYANWGFMYAANDGFPETAPVGSFPAGRNRWGVLDLAGNVAEWTSSPFDATGARRVFRGGAWQDNQTYSVRATSRDSQAPQWQGWGIGFRCAR